MAYYDEAEIRKALAILKPNDEIFEIRILGAAKKNFSGYFRDVDVMLEELKKIDLRGTNVYFSVNSVNEACYDRQQRDKLIQYSKATTSDNDICSYDYIMIDLDPKRPTDTSSTNEQVQIAKDLGNKIYQFLKGIGFAQPVFGFSGNGVHLLYKVALKNCDDNKFLIKRALETLALLFDTEEVQVDTTTFNPSRICKLYGTLAQKGSSTAKRPHRMSYVLNGPEEVAVTDIEYIRKLVGYYPVELEKPQRYNNYNPREFDLEEWIDKYHLNYKKTSFSGGTKYLLDCCPFDSNHKGKDAALFKMNNGAIGFHCFHNSCADKTWKDVRLLFEPDAYEQKEQYEQKIKYQSFNRDKPPVQHIEEKANEPIFETALQILQKKEEPKTYIKTGITDFDQKTGGLIKGQVSLVSGVRGSAKSTLLGQINLNALDVGNRVAVFSGELKDTRYMNWLYRQAAGKAYVKANAKFENSYYVEEKIQYKIAQWLGENFYLYNNSYGNDFNAMLEQFEKIVKEKKLDLLILDNLMAFNIKALSENKFDAQSEFVLTLHRMAEENNIHIIFVAHPRKSFGFLRLDDVSGSADLANAVDNAFIVHRNNRDFQTKTAQMFGWKQDDEIYLSTNVIEVCKERENGLQDVFIPLFFETETKRLKNDFAENVIYGWNTGDKGFTSLSEEEAKEVGEIFEDIQEESPFNLIGDEGQLSIEDFQQDDGSSPFSN